MRKRKWMIAVALCLLVCVAARGQGRGPGGGGGAPGGGAPRGGGSQGGPGTGERGGQPGGAEGMDGGGRGGIPPAARGSGSGGFSGGSAAGPVGRWWDDRGFAQRVGLRPEQRSRMDAIFNANRTELQQRVQTLRTEESRLQQTLDSGKPAGESLFGQIDRVAAAREALQQTNTRMVDALRKELDADQLDKLKTAK